MANNLRFISNLQYRLSEHPPSSPYCEEELTILSSGGMQPNHKISYINRLDNIITTIQIANNFTFISNLQYRLSEHPPSSPCYEEELTVLFSDGTTIQSYFYRRNNFIATSQIVYNLIFISNLQYRLSEHPPSSPCCEED